MEMLSKYIHSLLTFVLLSAVTLSASAVTIEHVKGQTDIQQVPERVVVLGHGSLDTLNYLGIKPVGALHSLLPEYLKEYKDSTVNSGSFHEPDLEAIYTLKPDLIIVENRMVHMYDELSKIAPAVMFYVDDGQYWQDTQRNWRMIGTIFGLQEKVEQKISETDQALIKTSSQIKRQDLEALMVMNNGGKIAMYTKGSRFSALFDVFGFDDASEAPVKNANKPHGNLISFEYILDVEPEVLFVLDREQAIGKSEGRARNLFDNDLVNSTPAGKTGKVVFIDPNAWYITAGGITATDQIISDVSSAL